MRVPHGTRIGIIVSGAALNSTLLLVALAFAGATEVTTTIQGTALGPGKLTRTIIDAAPQPAPAGRRTVAFNNPTPPSIVVLIGTGMTSIQVARALRDSINNHPSLQLSGYSASFCDSSQVKMIRASGTFTFSDYEDVPGMSLSYAGGDTVWAGHIFDPSYSHGGWMPAGGYGPYKLGIGPALPVASGGTVGDNGLWDFDRFQPSEQDSLQGWWPVARAYQGAVSGIPDYRRAFEGMDHGNQANYVINQGLPKRTFGVTGLWHRDRGNASYAPSDTMAGSNVQPVSWSPTEVGGAGSTASAWCGIRASGDLSVVDAIANGGTGNAFNAAVTQYQGNNGFHAIGSVSVNGTDHNFPGYGSQWDQMLYRDVVLAEGDGLTLSFNFSTTMSTAKNTGAATQVGWFDKDPVSNAKIGVGSGATPSSDGNFISATVAGANAPCDSFMVYIGAPVNDNAVTFTEPLFVGGNEITTVYDKKRRWMSEVIRCTPDDPHYKELASYAGIHTPTAVSVNVGALYPTVLQDIKNADGASGNGGVVRLVFRVKTNRGFDDENAGNPSAAFNSGTRGAAIVDNVVVNGWAAANGNFEAANSINNDVGVAPTAAWKSTGKPPGVFFHVHSLNTLPFSNPAIGNLSGKVLSIGDHDEAEKAAGLFGSNQTDRMSGVVSPTINLRSSGPGTPNAMGIDATIANATDGLYLRYEAYTGVLDTSSTGVGWVVGVQSYPARSPNGGRGWGELRYSPVLSSPTVRSLIDVQGLECLGLVLTSNPGGVPDSIRVYLGAVTRCEADGLTAPECAPTFGSQAGGYFDNVALGFVNELTGGAYPVTAPEPKLPDASFLGAPSPNPFTSGSLIAYELPAEGPVTLIVHDLLGRRVRALLDQVRPAGRWSVPWDGRDDVGRSLPSGVYLVRMRFGAEVQQRVIVKVR